MAKAQQEDTLRKLKQDIRSRQAERLYFFYGEETFLLHYYLEQLRKLLLDDLTESFNFQKLTVEGFDMRELGDSVEKLPMMAEHTLVWVDEVDIFKLPEGDRNRLIEILQDIPEYCTVVFTFITTLWKPDKRLKKLWEVVEEKGVQVEFAKQEEKDLIPWITRHFASQGKRISTELCRYLMDITGGTMTALSGEISKISAFSGREEIQKSDIDAVTEPVLDAVVFQMTDLMSLGDYGGALKKLQTLLKMQQEPIVILGAIGGHFRRLSAARTLSDAGRGQSELMRLCSMGDYQARKTMGAARKFSPEFYRICSGLILETDYKMKTSFDEQERLLEMLVMELAREARRG